MQRAWTKKEETSSPTTYLESIIITYVIYNQEDRYAATKDIPNVFIQTLIDRKLGERKSY